jgi:type II secretory pathway pseudopilin PulG
VSGRNRQHRRRPRGGGFTLVEVGFSIAIIAILIGLLLVGLNQMNKAARRAVERQNVASLKMAVDHFQDTFGFLPPLVRDGRPGVGSFPPQPAAGMLTGASEPVAQRSIAGVTRRAPVVYSEEYLADVEFLRGEPENVAFHRFSTHSIPFYLLGALDEDVDGVAGAGFQAPQPDGSFRVAGGQRYDPFFDTSKNPEGLVRTNPQEGRIELRDRNGVAYRYYRWLPGNEFGEINEADDLNIPALLGTAEENPELRSARFAIVAAGPNRVFGERATEDDLDLKLGLSTGDQRAESLGRQDNIVEVGR